MLQCFSIDHSKLPWLQVPTSVTEAVCSLAKLERAIVSCPAEKAQSSGRGGGALVPAPPSNVDRVELELQLLSMLQVSPAPLGCDVPCCWGQQEVTRQ